MPYMVEFAKTDVSGGVWCMEGSVFPSEWNAELHSSKIISIVSYVVHTDDLSKLRKYLKDKFGTPDDMSYKIFELKDVDEEATED
jgi:hypothetical protein